MVDKKCLFFAKKAIDINSKFSESSFRNLMIQTINLEEFYYVLLEE